MANTEEIFSEEEMLLLVLLFCSCLRYPGLHGRRNDANISVSTRKGNEFDHFSYACAYACVAPVYTLVYGAYACVARAKHPLSH